LWAALQRPSMETPKHHSNARACTSSAGTSAPSSTAFVVQFSIRIRATFASPEPTETGGDRRRSPACRTAGLKPMANGTRRVLPFGSPKGAGQHRQTRRSTGGIARSQVDPPQDGTGARVPRHRRVRDRSPHRPSSDRQPRLREGLNGLPEAIAEVLRHHVGDGGRRVSEAAPTGALYARFVVEPAYSLGPHSVSPLRRLAGGCAPSDPRTGNGAP